MIVRKSFKFRLKPSDDQMQKMHEYCGHCRFLWNKLLSMNLERLENKQKLIWYREADCFSKPPKLESITFKAKANVLDKIQRQVLLKKHEGLYSYSRVQWVIHAIKEKLERDEKKKELDSKTLFSPQNPITIKLGEDLMKRLEKKSLQLEKSKGKEINDV